MRERGILLTLDGSELRYSAPRGALTAELRDELRCRKPEIVATLARAKPEAPVLPPTRPLSPTEQRFWFLDRLSPEAPTYNAAIRLDVEGRLDHDALARSLDALIARHEGLRTTVEEEDGVARARAVQAAGAPLRIVDWRSRAGESLEHALVELLRAEARRPFDLTKAPMLRALAVQLADDVHVVLLVTHHFACDGWSLGLLLRELLVLHDSFASGRPSPLPPPRWQYRDFAAWQQRHLASGRFDEQLAYWREALAGAPTALDLPTDRPRPRVQSGHGATWRFVIPTAVAGAVRAAAREHGVTVFTFLLAALQIVLRRYSRDDELVVATAVSTRNVPDAEGVVGPCGNNLALRGVLALDASFRSVLTAARDTSIGALTHQDLPFERLVDALGVQRDLGRSPVFQTMFVLHQAPGVLEVGPLRVRARTLDFGTAKLDLELSMFDEGDGSLAGALEYASDLFDADTAQRLAAGFVRVAAQAAADPSVCVRDFRLDDEDSRRAVAVWNETARDFAYDTPLHRLIEAQVRAEPGRAAVSFEGRSLTYGELDVLANQLAYELVALGVGRDTPVAVAMERSLELVVALLAVLKAGGAYLPIDPTYPDARIAFMLADAAVRPDGSNEGQVVALASSAAAAKLTGARVLSVEGAYGAARGVDEGWAFAHRPRICPERVTSPEDLAYVIYTSGSTGRPKGVMVPHRGVVNRLLWMQAEYGLERDDVVLQKTPFTFDVSVWEFFWPLIVGARLVVARPDGHRDPTYLSDLIRDEGVTTLHFVPTMLRAFLDATALDEASLEGHVVKRVFASGEALTPELVDMLLGRHPNIALYNLYGPTEASVDVTHHTCRVGEPVVAIGRPIANVQMHVLDDRGLPQAVGVPGELAIGGVCLARGYLNREELTRQRFVVIEGLGRLYRTGDRGRWRADGELEYLGRLDDQVKLRGFRIELGEIAESLRAHPRVRDAAVVVRDMGAKDRQLVAYVCPTDDEGPSNDELRAALAKALPEYMVPAYFVTLDRLPTTTSGKLDARALPAPDVQVASPVAPVAPRDDVENELAGVWRSVLGLADVGVHDNFFAVGGDSILSIRVVTAARTLGMRLTVQDVFDHPTVAGLATVLRDAPSSAAAAPVEETDGSPVPVPPIARWFWRRVRTDRHHHHQSFLLHLSREVDADALERALASVAQHHEALRLTVVESGEGVVFVLPSVDRDARECFPLTVVASSTPGAKVNEVAEALSRGIRLDGPLARAALVRSPGDAPMLIVAIHHLVVDALSWPPLLEDLVTAYEAFEAGRAPVLPTKTASYLAWAKHVASLAGEAEGPGMPEEPAAAGDVGREGDAEDLCVRFDREETERVFAAGRRARAHVEELVLSAVIGALAEWTGNERIGVDVEGHGRQRNGLDVSRSVGWFTSVSHVEVERDVDATAAARLSRVKEALRAARSAPASHPRVGTVALFNYLGGATPSASSGLVARIEPAPMARSPRAERTHRLEVNVTLTGGELEVHVRFCPNLDPQPAVRAFADTTMAQLRKLAETRGLEAAAIAPSDFPLASLDECGVRRLRQLDPEDVFPTTPLQELMLESDRRGIPGNGVAHFSFSIQGELDASAFGRAWRETLAAHPALRASFLEGSWGPLQVVHRRAELPLDVHDLRGADEPSQRRAIDETIRAWRARGFRPDACPQMAVALFRRAEAKWQVVWVFSYRLLDGWSINRVLAEVFERYAGDGGDAAGPRRTERLPYREFIASLSAARGAPRDLFRCPAERRGATTLAPTPRDSAKGTYFKRRAVLSVADSERLKRVARENRITLSTIAFASWALRLAQGALDELHAATPTPAPPRSLVVTLGVAVSGRSAATPGLDEMIGSAIHFLPLHVPVDPGESVARFLERVAALQAEVQRHEHAPAACIRAVSQTENALPFDSYVVVENFPVDPSFFASARAWRIDDFEDLVQTEHPLRIEIYPTVPVAITMSSYSAFFDETALDQEISAFGGLLARLSQSPAARIAEVLG